MVRPYLFTHKHNAVNGCFFIIQFNIIIINMVMSLLFFFIVFGKIHIYPSIFYYGYIFIFLYYIWLCHYSFLFSNKIHIYPLVFLLWPHLYSLKYIYIYIYIYLYLLFRSMFFNVSMIKISIKKKKKTYF